MNKLLTVALLAQGANAFAPAGKPLAAVQQQRLDVVALSMNAPFFASEEPSADAPAAEADGETDFDTMSLEEEVETLANEEITKMKRASNLRNANGVEYAPWMNITPEAEAEIKTVMKQKAEARRKRKDQEAGVSGALLMDSQAQELSGGGLNCKVVSNNEVELTWATSSEASTKGFAIKRRKARTEDFVTIASYESWGPLASKGVDGGQYSYLDDTISPGGWVYRITECETSGAENDICQALVEVQTEDEQRGAVIAAVGIVVLAIGAFAAGIMLDPVGGF
ncbi:unnamed protein product [Pseudo-nitzschia multistriata]|uniref:Fibronectin type-III domain-containing protein n=1 Tax=Pseudo-nitzschia multistriata TaxID=183589 RepID=A0A448YZW3_9STRA|nr:unnamed protein product [Pseudo-nitzschia multistriata]